MGGLVEVAAAVYITQGSIMILDTVMEVMGYLEVVEKEQVKHQEKFRQQMVCQIQVGEVAEGNIMVNL